MKTKKIQKYIDSIERHLLNKPQQWVKLDDIKIDILTPNKDFEYFRRGYQELRSVGRIDIVGNEARINQ